MSVKQRYTSWPWNRPGFDRATWAGCFIRFPSAWFGMPLLALLIPLAWATLEPQPDQRRWPMSQEPSANMRIIGGRISRVLGAGPCPFGTLTAVAVLPQK